jgi:6-pyruvoyltetrahydropterin/6-carboxytetrahydropterin synthase
MHELMVEETFDSAHALRGYEGPCENLHGHTWKVQVFLRGQKLNGLGLLEDFKNIRKELREILSEYDHHLLNDLPAFAAINPSSENISRELFEKMKPKFKNLFRVVVWESASTSAAYEE